MKNQIKLQRLGQMCKSIIIFTIITALLIIISGCADNYIPPKPLPTEETGNSVNMSEKKEDLPEKPLPENGYGKFFFKKSKVSSKLIFVPHSGNKDNMIVKLEDWDTGKVICWFFIREGKKFETPIPEGNYRFKIATGTKWYGEEHLFGRDANYSNISSSVKIPARTNYTLNLTPSISGTLRDETIEPKDF